MGYHARGDQLLLFGGADYRSLSDTWIWRPEGWSRATNRSSPLPRHDPSMAYDADAGELVLFGGVQATGKAKQPLVELEDTWVWDGSRWWDGPRHGTPVCGVHSLMAFDPKRHQVLLVTQPLQRHTQASGSESGSGPPLVQTWVRADSAWVLQECTSAPVADGGVTADPVPGDAFPWPIYHPNPFDAGASMAFDPITEQVILYQCNRYRVPGSPAGRFLTWGWDGEAWTLLLAEEHRINTR